LLDYFQKSFVPDSAPLNARRDAFTFSLLYQPPTHPTNIRKIIQTCKLLPQKVINIQMWKSFLKKSYQH
jgi:hypothetical protein